MSEPTDWGLEYPFIVCQTNGGPYEDVSFVAGVYFGMIMQTFDLQSRIAKVSDSVKPIPMTIPTSLLPQIDLLAMRWGCSVTLEQHDETPEWTTIRFSKADK